MNDTIRHSLTVRVVIALQDDLEATNATLAEKTGIPVGSFRMVVWRLRQLHKQEGKEQPKWLNIRYQKMAWTTSQIEQAVAQVRAEKESRKGDMS